MITHEKALGEQWCKEKETGPAKDLAWVTARKAMSLGHSNTRESHRQCRWTGSQVRPENAS